MEKEKSRFIFTINFDWRDLYHADKGEMYEKLQRDQLRPDINKLFFFSWSHVNYQSLEGDWQTIHARTFGLEYVRPILNLISIIRVPYTAWKLKLRPDVWLAYDFGMVPALWVCRKLFGGHLIMLVNNQPYIYSRTRKLGLVKGWYSWLMERMFSGLPEHYFTLNETMRAYLAELGVPGEKTTIFVVNTIERDATYIAQANPGWLRATYDLHPDKKIILAVARLEAEKGYPLLLNLFSRLPDQYVLCCLGEGSLRETLEEQVRALGMTDRVYMPGNIARSDIWNYYKGADAFVLLSNAEALGIVFWEAMYVGLPVLGRNVQGIVESLGRDGERGRVWDESEGPDTFQEKITFCTTPSRERDSMTMRAKQYVDARLQNHTTFNSYLADREGHTDTRS